MRKALLHRVGVSSLQLRVFNQQRSFRRVFKFPRDKVLNPSCLRGSLVFHQRRFVENYRWDPVPTNLMPKSQGGKMVPDTRGIMVARTLCAVVCASVFLLIFRDFYVKKLEPPAFLPIFQNINPLVEPVTQKCFLDIAIEGTPAGRIVVGLFGEVCPRTSENFRALCTGEKGISKVSGKPLHYKGIRFHRIVGRFLCQAGDITEGNGDGGESIYGPTFDDENHTLSCKGIGVIAMANSGRNTNSSQFWISTNPDNDHLSGKYVVFGRVLEGFRTLKSIESCGSPSGKPRILATISDCGELPLDYTLASDPKNRLKLHDDPSKMLFSAKEKMF